MRIAVLGASGSMGSRVAEQVRRQGHECVAASRSSGVDGYSGDGLREALDGVDAVVDCMDQMTTNAAKARDFFGTVAGNVVRAAREAGVARIVCLSIAGAIDGEVNKRFGYYQGKAAQEETYLAATAEGPEIRVLRSTQWFGFPAQFAGQMILGPIAVVPSMLTAPVSEERVAELLVELAVSGSDDGESGTSGEPDESGAPADSDERIVSVRGPETARLADFVRRQIAAAGEIAGKSPRLVVQVPLFGRAFAHGGLVPDDGIVDSARFGEYLDALKG